MFNEVGLDLMASVRILVLPLTNLLIHMQITPSEPQFSSSAHLSGLLGPGKESVPYTGQLSLYCNGMPRLDARLVRHDPLLWFWYVASGQQLWPSLLTLFCPILPCFICPERGQGEEHQLELEGCLEEAWTEGWEGPGDQRSKGSREKV